MLFSEPRFFLFFAVYGVLHLIVPPRFRLWLVILGGAAFYASHTEPEVHAFTR